MAHYTTAGHKTGTFFSTRYKNMQIHWSFARTHVLERDPLLTLCKCVAHRGVLIRSQHTCVFNHLVAQLRNRLAHSIPTWEAASQTGTLHIFSSPAPNSTFSPHFSRTIAIQTCPPSRAAA